MNLLEIIQGQIQANLKTSDLTDAGEADVKNTSDIHFNNTRNRINQGSKMSASNIQDYLEKAHELNDEVESVPFGIETSDGKIIKVYVNADQADAFKEEMAARLGIDYDIEEVMADLIQSYDIVDIIWPEDMTNPIDSIPDECEKEEKPTEQLPLDSIEDASEEPEEKPTKSDISKIAKKAVKNLTEGFESLNGIELDSYQKSIYQKLTIQMEKKLLEFIALVGIHGRYLDGDIEQKISLAAKEFRESTSKRTALNNFFSALKSAKAKSTKIEEAKHVVGSATQKMLELILSKIGVPPEIIDEDMPQSVRNNIRRTCLVIQKDHDLYRLMKTLGNKLDIKLSDDIKEALYQKVFENVNLSNDEYTELVLNLCSALGIPDQNLMYQKSNLLMSIKKAKAQSKNYSLTKINIQKLINIILNNQKPVENKEVESNAVNTEKGIQ